MPSHLLLLVPGNRIKIAVKLSNRVSRVVFDLRAGEEIPVSEVLEPGGQGRDRGSAGSEQCPGDHVVSEPKSEAEEGHGGAEEGRADGESSVGRATPQDLSRERSGSRDPEEATSAQFHGREVVEEAAPGRWWSSSSKRSIPPYRR